MSEENAHPELTYAQVELMAGWAFGERGTQTARCWAQYNTAYFAGELHPVPIMFVPAAPYGLWLGLHAGDEGYTAYIWILRGRDWATTRGVLLHEMVHQWLWQNGHAAAHASPGWREAITRLSADHFGQVIHAEGTRVIKEKVEGVWKSRRVPIALADSGQALTDGEIARWPHSVGIVPPDVLS